MKHFMEFFIRIFLLVIIWLIWWWAIITPLSGVMNLSVIFGGVLLTYPIVWFGRKILDSQPTKGRVAWITTFVHYALGISFGLPVIRALVTHQDWSGYLSPVPKEIGFLFVVISGILCSLTVLNLALKGLGAPFAIALSRRLTTDWFYARTRNPMVIAALALLLSLGIWFQSVLFLIWALFLFSPALLFFVKVYEERELELRFGESYREYKSRTPMLFPGKPRKRKNNRK
jgi:protein-S-isoprenylcysteine O-methyltransferase Ste14